MLRKSKSSGMCTMQVLREVLQKIKPSREERELIERIKGELLGLVKEEIEKAGLEVRPYFVGSLAKDTYLAGDHDIDLFLAFPLDTPIAELREEGFKLAEAIGKRLDSYEKAYAEHPYISGRYRGFDVDLVPCYDVNSWRDVRTAVDRSILHNRWVLEHLKGRNDEVRLLKRFFKGINVYGSEIYVRGFSGYLTELLIIHFGSFLDVLEGADFMHRKKIIDPEGWLKKERERALKTIEREKGAPLIVLDPVDPRRNVASALSWEKFARFYFKANEFLKAPSEGFFFPGERQIGDYRHVLRSRGTHMVILMFRKPPLIDDILLPQLEKSARGFQKALEKQGFEIYGINWGYENRAFIMFEVDRAERPRIKPLPGPEFYSRRALPFYEKHGKVWVKGKRLFSEREQKESIVDVILELLGKNQVSLGRNLKDIIENADILVDFAPPELRREAYLFLTREKWNLK